MRTIKLFLNVIFILILLLTALGSSSMIAQADNGEILKADPRLLQMAEENPDATFMVIVQKDAKNKDLKDKDAEVTVEKGGGQIKKQLDMIFSFSAEMTGKEISKLAKHPKCVGSRWMRPWFRRQPATKSPTKAVVARAPMAALGTIYTIINTNNSGTGSLRQAITDANNHSGADTIRFNIAGTGVHTITPTTALPKITGRSLLKPTPIIACHNGSRPTDYTSM